MKYFYYSSACVLFKLTSLETPVVVAAAAQAEVRLHGESLPREFLQVTPACWEADLLDFAVKMAQQSLDIHGEKTVENRKHSNMSTVCPQLLPPCM